jgi:hypothetical protein
MNKIAVVFLSVFCLFQPELFTRMPSSTDVLLNAINSPDGRRGCCSWHQGVCGCQSGRALCCDGTLSPSCGCN